MLGTLNHHLTKAHNLEASYQKLYFNLRNTKIQWNLPISFTRKHVIFNIPLQLLPVSTPTARLPVSRRPKVSTRSMSACLRARMHLQLMKEPSPQLPAASLESLTHNPSTHLWSRTLVFALLQCDFYAACLSLPPTFFTLLAEEFISVFY